MRKKANTPIRQKFFIKKLLTGAVLGAAIGFLVKELDLPSLVSYWYARAPLVLICVFFFSLLALTRVFFLSWGVFVGLFLLWVLVAFTPFSKAIVGDLPRRDFLEKSDAVFVFSSGLQADGELSSVAMSRLLGGIALVEQGFASRLILSELYPPQASYQDAANTLLKRLGLSQEILVVGPVGNTHDEALAVARLFQEKQYKRVIAVTSPVHAKRASATLEKEGLKVISFPSMETRYDLQSLQHTDDRIRAFSTIMHEWIGIWIYRRRGWI